MERKETYWTTIWLIKLLLNNNNSSKECQKNEKEKENVVYCIVNLCNVWLDQQCLMKTCFWLLFTHCFLTLMFEFVVEICVCSVRVYIYIYIYIAFRRQRIGSNVWLPIIPSHRLVFSTTFFIFPFLFRFVAD